MGIVRIRMALTGLVVAALGGAAVMAGTTPAGAGSGVNAQTSHSFTYDGLTRSYLKYVPPSMPAGGRPLVMVLHGGSESAAAISDPGDPRSHWKELADTDKFFVVYPDGVSNQWHDCRSDGHGAIGTADDVGFLTSLIAQMDAAHDIDLTRVYATGFSNGGIMSMRLAAEATDQFAAIAPGIAGRAVDPAGECRAPDRPITVALMPGDADTRMPWNGGCVWDNQCTRGTVQGAVTTRDYWIGVNGTGATADVTVNHPDTYAADGPSTVTQTRYQGGTNGTEVAWFRVNGGGHNTPSTHHFIGSLLVGPQNRDIESSTELWNVIKNHTRSTAVPVVESTPFADGFEAGNTNSWTKTGTVVASTTTPASGTYVAQTQGAGSITRVQSTVGATKVRVRFNRKTSAINRFDAGEWFKAEWSTNGTTWNLIQQTTQTAYQKETFTLPAAAAGQSGFRIRFSSNANQSNEYGYVDDVAILTY